MADDPKPDAVNQEVPRTKEDWQKLAKENPVRFTELSQPRIDELTRKEREANEKLTVVEQREKNLLAEIERLKQPPVVEDTSDRPQYGVGKYPQTQEEWDNLSLEHPTLAIDLRNRFLRDREEAESSFVKSRSQAAKTVQSEHPEMYVIELDDMGKPKNDAQGKPVLRQDPNFNDGRPIFNPESEKGKLWLEIWNEDPNGWNSLKNAPSLMMSEMERRLRVKGANMVNQAQNSSGNIDQSGLAPKGVNPPAAGSLKFASEEERAIAQKAVERGTYSSLEDFCKWRDKGTVTFDHSNSRPDFTKK